MKKLRMTICLLITSPFFIAVAQAHDPSEHKETMEKPKCAAMKNMDESKMDVNDPVIMAVMKKCKNEGPAENHQKGDAVKSPASSSSANKASQHDEGHGH